MKSSSFHTTGVISARRLAADLRCVTRFLPRNAHTSAAAAAAAEAATREKERERERGLRRHTGTITEGERHWAREQASQLTPEPSLLHSIHPSFLPVVPSAPRVITGAVTPSQGPRDASVRDVGSC